MSNETVLSNFTLREEDIISERLNVILQNFAENDKYVYGQFDKIPGIWKCLWYNDDRIRGYDKGTFFWLNTENRQNFLKNNAKEMQKMVDVNPAIPAAEKLPDWKSNDEEIFRKYNNVLTGYFDATRSTPLLPWAEIGTLSACTQLVISQKDNNKTKITDKNGWKKFILEKEDVDDIMVQTQQAVNSAMTMHESEYHFGDEMRKYTTTSELQKALDNITGTLDNYVDANFNNIEMSYPENYLGNDFYCSGFDTIDLFVNKPIPNRALSGYVVERQWFRLWRSGFLEHGGLVKTSECLNTAKTKVQIDFDWELSSSFSKFYAVKYLGDEPDKILTVDESEEDGDNLLSVLYELDPSYFSSLDRKDSLQRKAPKFLANDYSLNLTPIYPTAGLSTLATSTPYSGIGNYSVERNVVATDLKLTDIYNNRIEIPYDSKIAPPYYAYYAAGFCLKQTS